MKLERRFIPAGDAELRMDGDEPVISGHAAVFNKWSEIGGWGMERIAPGAFAESIKTDDIRALFNHDPNLVLGRTTNGTLRLKEDTKGLFMEADPPDTQTGRDVVTLIKRGDVTGQSFGFEVLEDSWAKKEIDGVPVDHRTIKKVRLYDVSPVVYPAYTQTDVAVRSAQEAFEEHRKLEAPDVSEGSGDDDAAGRVYTPQMTSKGNALALRNREI